MKKIVSVISLAFIMMLSLYAEDFAIRKASDLRLETYSIATADGSYMVFWSDRDSGDADIYCQKISSDAQVLFNEAVPLITGPGDQKLQRASRSSDNNFFVIWADIDIETVMGQRIQKVSSNSQALWGNGAQFSNTPITYGDIFILPDDQGGAYVFHQRPYHKEIIGQHLDSFGNCLWPISGKTLVDYDESSIRLDSVVTDGEGGFILNVAYQINSIWNSRLLRFSASGTQIGEEPILPHNALEFIDYQILPPVNGQYVIYRAPDPGSKTMYLNKMDVNGNLLLDTSLSYELGSLDYGTLKSITNTPNAGVAVCWTAHETDTDIQFQSQQFSPSLSAVWSQPVTVSAENINVSSTKLNPLADGSLWLFWHGNYEDPYFKTQLLDSAGYPIFEQGGKLITDQSSSYLGIGNQNKGIMLWETVESGYKKLNIQGVSLNGALSYSEGGYTLQQCLNYNCQIYDTFSLGNRYLSLWLDNRDNTSINFQLLDQNGQALLEPAGRAATTNILGTIDIKAATTTQNNELVFIYRSTTDTPDGLEYVTYLQTINAMGELGFSPNGLVLPGNAERLSAVDNAIYITWVQPYENSSSGIMGQKLLNHQPVWGDSGKLIKIIPENLYTEIVGMAGHYIIWEQISLDEDYITQCKTLRIDDNGDPASGWDPMGMDIFEGLSYRDEELKDAGIIDDDLVVFVSLFKYSTHSQRIQRINAASQRLWGAGGLVFGDTNDFKQIASVVYDDEISYLATGANNCINLHRVSATGEPITPVEGVVVIPNPNHCYDAVLKKFANGSMLCAYSDNDGYLIQNRDLYIRHIDPYGIPSGDSPILLCGERYQQEYTRMAVIGNDALITWADSRTGIMNGEETWAGIWGQMVSSQYVATDDPHASLVTVPGIIGNYPNPFNPSTNISYSLPSPAAVSLYIYNLKGQKVKTLLSNVNSPAGTHVEIWNGTDDSGKLVSSGMYFCRLEADGYKAVRKMILAK
ncbi:MAG: T9SS type A sorting domain-containing protein [Candidatus Cloacimonetes bacterium]|nr:T9SS type A sorting domain-containing protein [Candidatus Cloacimonadota bacterium]MDD2507305.1 T9SS type A sorting domain-containing protein [Candidatus Cloacimonadota bacterium]MDD4560712.1 T9SS type A sorting domain-containing protein [Candidatus Cloacimonadota bacterium]